MSRWTRTAAKPAQAAPDPMREPGATRRSAVLLLRCALLLLALGQPWVGDGARAAQGSAPAREILVYANAATRNHLHRNGGDQDGVLSVWRAFFRHHGLRARDLTRAELTGRLAPAVLVLPSAVALDDQEREAIRRFLARGGGVLATWAAGVLDGAGERRGWGFLEETFGVRVQGELKQDEEFWFFSPFGETPLTMEIPSGKRMWLGKVAQSPLRIDAPHLAARYVDFSYGAPPDGAANGAAAWDERGGGRVAYLSLPESAWTYSEADIHLLVRNALRWLAREPLLGKAAWPAPYRSAYVIEMDAEWQFENTLRFAAMMEGIKARTTFYCLTSEAVKFPRALRQLAARHEIGYHADVHTGFRDAPPADQEARMDRMAAQMRSLLGDVAALTGFRAPREEYDRHTEVLLRRKGLRYHAADPQSGNARLPLFSRAEPDSGADEALVVLPRMIGDDYTFRRLGYGDAAVRKALLHDFGSVAESGAFGLLSIHSQNFGPGGSMTATLPTLLEEVSRRRDTVWLAAGEDIAQWWRERDRVSGKLVAAGPGRFVLELDVRAPGTTRAVSFVLAGTGASGGVGVAPAAPGQPGVSLRVLDTHRTLLEFEPLKAGRYRYLVTP